MEIGRKAKKIVLTCSEKEAEVIAALLDNEREGCCSWDCPNQKAEYYCEEQTCIRLAEQIRSVLPQEEPKQEDTTIYLSGPAWLTRYECEVFNAVTALCKEPYGEITIALADLCRIIHGKPQGKEQIIETHRIIRKLERTKRDTKNSILLGCAHTLLHVDLVTMSDGSWGVRIICPSVERLVFEDIVYLGGSTGRFF